MVHGAWCVVACVVHDAWWHGAWCICMVEEVASLKQVYECISLPYALLPYERTAVLPCCHTIALFSHMSAPVRPTP